MRRTGRSCLPATKRATRERRTGCCPQTRPSSLRGEGSSEVGATDWSERASITWIDG